MTSNAPNPPTVFVTSATGSQGSALCHLLRSPSTNWTVRATTRNLDSPAARTLSSLGVHFSPGSWGDEAVLREALSGCDKLFLCLLSDLQDHGESPRQAALITRVARSVGVRQVVVSTTLGSCMIEPGGKPPMQPGGFFDELLRSKMREERTVEEGGFDSWTVLRPGFFMANFLEPKVRFGYAGPRDTRSWVNCMTERSLLGMVDHVDIARFAVAAFREPDKFHGRKIGVVSEELLVQDAMDVLAGAIGDGREIKAVFMSDDEIREAQEAGSWLFFASEPNVRYMSEYTDLAELERLVPGLMTFEKFLERERDGVRETYWVGRSG